MDTKEAERINRLFEELQTKAERVTELGKHAFVRVPTPDGPLFSMCYPHMLESAVLLEDMAVIVREASSVVPNEYRGEVTDEQRKWTGGWSGPRS